MKWVKWLAATLGIVVFSLVVVILWIINTEIGTRWLFTRMTNALDGKLVVANVGGTLAGPLKLTGLRFKADASAPQLAVAAIDVDLQATALLRGTVTINHAEISDATLVLATDEQPDEPSAFDFQPPIDIEIKRFTLNDARVSRGENLLVEVTNAQLSGMWTSAGLFIKQLAVDSPQGRIRLAGNAKQTKNQNKNTAGNINQDGYAGHASGEFHWTVGTRTYAGQLNADAKDQHAALTVQFSAPIKADVRLSVVQAPELPWTLHVKAPKFDPRRELLPSSSLHSLAMALQGEGTRTQGMLSGQIVINDEAIDISTLRFTSLDQTIVLNALEVRLADTPSVLNATGRINLENSPLASLQAQWKNVQLPKNLVGQPLNTHGALKFEGSAEKFSVNGDFSLGPPGRLARMALQATGSSNQIELQKLTVAQTSGSLNAIGKVQWQPQLNWHISAKASSFDPGEIFAAWKGDLNFALASNGRNADAGLRVAVDLAHLNGRLRGRKLSGVGQLEFISPSVLAGNLSLRADQSSIEFRGARGNEMNASISVDIKSLNDWIPDAKGTAQAQFTAKGKWPMLAINGRAQGARISVAGVAVNTLDFSMEAQNPQHPVGSIRLEANEVSSGGFDFSTLNVELAGSESDHALKLAAEGKLLSITVSVQGTRKEKVWSGSLQQLMLDLEGSNQFALRAPAQLKYSPDGVHVEEICLTSEVTQLCAAGKSTANGELSLRYRLTDVPLQLVSVFVPTLPISIRGTVQGDGNIQRSVNGTWVGKAVINSAAGELSRTVVTESTPVPLLSYQRLQLVANLNGTQARGSLSAELDRTGSLRGALDVSGLGASSTTLNGHMSATLPSLAALSLITPQLAQVNGRARLQANVAGTVAAPKFSGELHASELTAQLPALGVQIKNGKLDAAPNANGDIVLAGTLDSGNGQLNFNGDWNTRNELRLSIAGKNFLAADIPSAHVVVAPDLKFTHLDRKFEVNGSVTVVNAAINVQKLPRGARPPRASEDVIVVDEETPQEAAAKSIPLIANVTVILSDDIKIEGYGLNATVEGQIDVRERPGDVTRGSGEVSIAGTYKAYGQDLTIRDGHVLFADAPLSNPRLNITAVRQIQNVTAGLRISGRAQTPQLSIFSDPAMDEAHALSYLVAGRPLDEIGTSESDGSALQSAAQSLGTAGGGLLAKKLGARLGISELTVKDNELIGGAAFTVGEYLSPRLFLSYGVGLFQPGEVVTLRYRLSDDWSLQTQSSSEETRAGIEYRIEK